MKEEQINKSVILDSILPIATDALDEEARAEASISDTEDKDIKDILNG